MIVLDILNIKNQNDASDDDSITVWFLKSIRNRIS